MRIQKEKKESCSFLFKINSECNDSCPFCLEHESIKLKRPRMNFPDFKKNLAYLKKIYEPNYTIISGGEPTLHPEFLKMLSYLKGKGDGFRFITNLISLSDFEYAKKVKEIFSDFKSLKQEKKCKIVASINDASSKDLVAQKRYEGLMNIVDLEIPFVIVVTIYHDNLKSLPDVAQNICNIINGGSRNSIYNIEFRMIYHIKTLDSLLQKTLPNKPEDIKKSLEKCVEILDDPKISLTVWNFPICYLNNYDKIDNNGIEERKKRKIIRINVDEQLEKYNIEDWLDYFKKYKECENCIMSNYCTGIDEGYINSSYYRKIKAIK